MRTSALSGLKRFKRLTGAAVAAAALLSASCSDNGAGPSGGGGGGGSGYTLTTLASPAAGGTVGSSPQQDGYAPGTLVTLAAVSADGYEFTGWSGAGLTSATANPTVVTMDADRTITANFQARYTLTVSASPAGAGTVGSNPHQSSYPPGTQVTLTATPTTDYVLVGWTGGVNANPTGNTATVTMNANRTITANFEQRANNITLTLTYWETTDTDAGGLDPRLHFSVVAIQNGREVSSNNTGYLLDAQDIGQSWSGSVRSSAIPFVAQADELRVYAVVVEKDLLFNDDISPGYYQIFKLPIANRESGTATLNYGSGKSTVRFSYTFGRQ